MNTDTNQPKTYAFESTGGCNCFRCGTVIPRGLVVLCTGIYDYCPACTQDYLPTRIPQATIDTALEAFWRSALGTSERTTTTGEGAR